MVCLGVCLGEGEVTLPAELSLLLRTSEAQEVDTTHTLVDSCYRAVVRILRIIIVHAAGTCILSVKSSILLPQKVCYVSFN